MHRLLLLAAIHTAAENERLFVSVRRGRLLHLQTFMDLRPIRIQQFTLALLQLAPARAQVYPEQRISLPYAFPDKKVFSPFPVFLSYIEY